MVVPPVGRPLGDVSPSWSPFYGRVLRWAELFSLVKPDAGGGGAAPESWFLDPVVARVLRGK